MTLQLTSITLSSLFKLNFEWLIFDHILNWGSHFLLEIEWINQDSSIVHKTYNQDQSLWCYHLS